MKKIVSFILVLALVFSLAGCGSKAQNPGGDETATTEQTLADLTQQTQPETKPAESTSEDTVPEETGAATQPTTPKEEATKPQEPAQTETKPQQIPPETKPQTSTTDAQGRKISSATCKDTGSDKIWENPDGNQLDYYEESDPERTAYIQYLLQGQYYFQFYLAEEDMRMYLGKTYGMPLIADSEIVFECTWSSSDPSVATVNQVGFVTPLKLGSTVINVTFVDPETLEAVSRSCNVWVETEPVYTYAYLEERAHEEAKKIAEYAKTNGKTDLEQIAIAAGLVNIYVADGSSGSRYGIVDGELTTVYVPGYNQPFGTLVTFYSTCAGSTRALGLVLEYMGFSWYHMGEDQWNHQWCVIYDVDGQTAFADGSMLGMAGYGTWQGDGSNWRQYRNGGLVPVSEQDIHMVQIQVSIPE